MCQCPFRALLYFYCEPVEDIIPEIVECQCPFRALLYFYANYIIRQEFINNVCQCPFRALLYFYKECMAKLVNKEICVNALSGLFFISTGVNTGCGCPVKIVSMPFQGSSLFLLMTAYTQFRINVKCQCPFRALLYFYTSPLEAAETKHFPGHFCR